ncbi:MAG: A/G-specific adenine glycosylase [Propionibacteriaceae bacterium]|nr:A/G-specific adenine glycosylase [Propionibacteriaceae bacterium]
MVSEFMLQQTPVARVLEPWRRWLERWPTPAAMAAEDPGEAVRAWGRLGYPRRALRLHAAATAIVRDHDGEVPRELDALRALPGVGEYTAAAIASFAFGQRHAVLDTNVRRVLARLDAGRSGPAITLTAAERKLAEAWLPGDPATAARWAVAVMELGAQLCTATIPSCQACPVTAHCRWLAAGRPTNAPLRRPQAYAGTDRQARGALLAVLREAAASIPREELLAAWPVDREQANRALDSLTVDGLIREAAPDRFQL